jgi:putative redox protein
MTIRIKKLDGERQMEARNEEGGAVRMDGTREIGGIEGGMSPMQLLLAAAGGCSTIDIMNILEKQKQKFQDIEVEVEGDRQKKDTYSEFTRIHLHYTLYGDLSPKKVERAISLSLNKYCSVTKALEKTSTITHSYEIKKSD